MGRLEEVFARRRAAGQKVLVAYLCMGDPSVDESVDLAVAAAEAGADVLELGVPFSDPTADGPTIARASQRSLARGGGLVATLRACALVRARSSAPIVLFGYYNPLFVHGVARSLEEAKAADVDALLVVDLPVDAAGSLRALAHGQGLAIVPLLAPTSGPARVAAVRAAHEATPSGFLYYVSLTGVTGAAAARPPEWLVEASAAAGSLGRATGLPAVVGFGIDSPEKARLAAAHTDGVVVGTALVRGIEEASSPEARASGVRTLVLDLRRALDS